MNDAVMIRSRAILAVRCAALVLFLGFCGLAAGALPGCGASASKDAAAHATPPLRDEMKKKGQAIAAAKGVKRSLSSTERQAGSRPTR